MQPERFDALLACSGLTTDELGAVQASEARGPLFAAFRDAESRGLDIDVAFPLVAAVLHRRVDCWTAAAAGRRQRSQNLIAGLIPRAHGVTNPELATALAERNLAMEARARTLAARAVVDAEAWVAALGAPPGDPTRRERWLRGASTVAAYRDRWHVTSGSPPGARVDVAVVMVTVLRVPVSPWWGGRLLQVSHVSLTDRAVEVGVRKGVER